MLYIVEKLVHIYHKLFTHRFQATYTWLSSKHSIRILCEKIFMIYLDLISI